MPTFLRAWQYPSQESVWTLVHAAKLGSWSLLVVVSIVLVAAVKSLEGRLYGAPTDLSVLRAYDEAVDYMQQREAFGKPLAAELLHLAQAQQWAQMDSLARRCRRAVWRRALLRRPLATLAGGLRHYVAEARR